MILAETRVLFTLALPQGQTALLCRTWLSVESNDFAAPKTIRPDGWLGFALRLSPVFRAIPNVTIQAI
jgi:hypothetical protein